MWSAALLCLTLAVPPAHAAPDPTDPVPWDHWSFTALAKLRGPERDREFHGDRQMTRYEVAMAVWRFLESQSAPGARRAEPLSADPVAPWAFARLLEEFWPELMLIEEQAGSRDGAEGLARRVQALSGDHWLAAEAGLVLQKVAPPPEAPAAPAAGRGALIYETVPFGHWAYDAVDALVEAGYVRGYPEGPGVHFIDDREMTRYEFAMALSRGLGAASKQPLAAGADRARVAWALCALTREFWCDLAEVQHEIDEMALDIDELEPGPEGWRPKHPALPEPPGHAAAEALRAFPEDHWFSADAQQLLDEVRTGKIAQAGVRPPEHPFADVPRDHWAYDAVETLRQKGIIAGYPANTPDEARFAAPPGSAGTPTPRPLPRSSVYDTVPFEHWAWEAGVVESVQRTLVPAGAQYVTFDDEGTTALPEMPNTNGMHGLAFVGLAGQVTVHVTSIRLVRPADRPGLEAEVGLDFDPGGAGREEGCAEVELGLLDEQGHVACGARARTAAQVAADIAYRLWSVEQITLPLPEAGPSLAQRAYAVASVLPYPPPPAGQAPRASAHDTVPFN